MAVLSKGSCKIVLRMKQPADPRRPIRNFRSPSHEWDAHLETVADSTGMNVSDFLRAAAEEKMLRVEQAKEEATP